MRSTGASSRIDELRAGGRVLELDGLRAIAVLVVVVQHYFVRPPLFLTKHPPAGELPLALQNIAAISWSGVDLFFVLSGFLIGGILLDHRGAPNLWRAFYSRRVFRIFPAYFLLLFLAFLPFLGNAAAGPKPTPFWVYALFIQNFWTGNGFEPVVFLWPVWTLAIEEQFYVVAPLLIARLSPRWLPRMLLLGVIGPFVLRCVVLWLGPRMPFRINVWDFTLCRVDGISMGVAAAWLVRDAAMLDRLRARVSWLKVGGFLSAIAIALLVQIPPSETRETALMSVGLTLLAVLSVCLVLVAILDPEGWLARVLRTRPLTSIGTHSYFVYLFHMVAVTLARSLPLTYWQRIGVAIVGLGVASRLSWRWFEMPLIRIGRSVSYEPPVTEGAVATASH